MPNAWSSHRLYPYPVPRTVPYIRMYRQAVAGVIVISSTWAALNRHVAGETTAQQQNPANFYLAGPANYYALFWHQNSINGKQYGFPYDDYAGQSPDNLGHQPAVLRRRRRLVTGAWPTPSPGSGDPPMGRDVVVSRSGTGGSHTSSAGGPGKQGNSLCGFEACRMR